MAEKYQPDFPERFASEEGARAFCQQFFAWYNHEHRHSGIGFMTPAAMHSGRAPQLYEARQVVLTQAFAEHPERFRGRLPMPPALPTQVGINLPTTTPRAQGERERSTINSPQPVSQSRWHAPCRASENSGQRGGLEVCRLQAAMWRRHYRAGKFGAVDPVPAVMAASAPARPMAAARGTPVKLLPVVATVPAAEQAPAPSLAQPSIEILLFAATVRVHGQVHAVALRTGEPPWSFRPRRDQRSGRGLPKGQPET